MEENEEKAVVATPSFFTNHAYVLMLIGNDNSVRMRDLALRIGITERAVQRIMEDLVSSGHVVIGKSGRRNAYSLNADGHLQNPLLRDFRVIDLLRLGSDRFGFAPSSSTPQ
jgi:predicted ArsR family transcriptional regulator